MRHIFQFTLNYLYDRDRRARQRAPCVSEIKGNVSFRIIPRAFFRVSVISGASARLRMTRVHRIESPDTFPPLSCFRFRLSCCFCCRSSNANIICYLHALFILLIIFTCALSLSLSFPRFSPQRTMSSSRAFERVDCTFTFFLLSLRFFPPSFFAGSLLAPWYRSQFRIPRTARGFALYCISRISRTFIAASLPADWLCQNFCRSAWSEAVNFRFARLSWLRVDLPRRGNGWESRARVVRARNNTLTSY